MMRAIVLVGAIGSTAASFIHAAPTPLVATKVTGHVELSAEQKKTMHFGCVSACKPSPIESKCATACETAMYRCVDETGPSETPEDTKKCQDKVLKLYEETKGVKKEEKKEAKKGGDKKDAKKDAKKEEKKAKKMFLQLSDDDETTDQEVEEASEEESASDETGDYTEQSDDSEEVAASEEETQEEDNSASDEETQDDSATEEDSEEETSEEIPEEEAPEEDESFMQMSKGADDDETVEETSEDAEEDGTEEVASTDEDAGEDAAEDAPADESAEAPEEEAAFMQVKKGNDDDNSDAAEVETAPIPEGTPAEEPAGVDEDEEAPEEEGSENKDSDATETAEVESLMQVTKGSDDGDAKEADTAPVEEEETATTPVEEAASTEDEQGEEAEDSEDPAAEALVEVGSSWKPEPCGELEAGVPCTKLYEHPQGSTFVTACPVGDQTNPESCGAYFGEKAAADQCPQITCPRALGVTMKLVCGGGCCPSCWAPDHVIAVDRHTTVDDAQVVDSAPQAPTTCGGVKCFKLACASGFTEGFVNGACCNSCVQGR